MVISHAHAFLTVPIEITKNPSDYGPIVIKCKLGFIVYGPTDNNESVTKHVCFANANK